MSRRRLLRAAVFYATFAAASTAFDAVVSVPSLRADEPRAAVAAFDATLLEIPDGETTEFYQKRLEVLFAELRARPSFKPGKNALPVELLSPEQSELAPAIATVLLKLADDASLTQPQRNQHFQRAIGLLGKANNLDALRTIAAKEKAVYNASPNNETALRVALTEQTIVASRFFNALQSVANRIIEFRADGSILDYLGTYDDFLEWRKTR